MKVPVGPGGLIQSSFRVLCPCKARREESRRMGSEEGEEKLERKKRMEDLRGKEKSRAGEGRRGRRWMRSRRSSKREETGWDGEKNKEEGQKLAWKDS